MTFPHPLRGTCIDGCRLYGFCHCGCRGPANISEQSHRAQGRIRGEPRVFIHGHSLRVFGRPTPPGAWQTNGVSIEQVLPMLRWLVKRHGSQRAAAAALGITEGAISYMLSQTVRRVRPSTAKAIVREVRRVGRGLDPHKTFEATEPPRDPLLRERRRIPRLRPGGPRDIDASSLLGEVLGRFGGTKPAARVWADLSGRSLEACERAILRARVSGLVSPGMHDELNRLLKDAA